MADDPTPPHRADSGADEEADLVAYLDGELDPAAARRVESRLEGDPRARTRAEVLKKTYDLLDYLPKPEPSATFASRTLDRLPAVGGSAGRPVAPAAASATPLCAPAPSGPAPLPLSTADVALPPPRRGWAWPVGGAAAAVLAVGLGYLGHAAARAYLFPPAEAALSFEGDRRVIRNLPLYAGLDDFEFLAQLAESDAFADDAGMYADLPVLPPALVQGAAEPPWKDDLEPLIRAFKALPAVRRAQVRELDRRLYGEPPAELARLFRAAEGYAVWLARLSEAERRAVLAAATPNLRAEVVRDIRDGQWKAQLPAEHRRQLNAAEPDRRADLIQRWRDEEAERRRVWLLHRKNWETLRNDRVPWPFDDEAAKRAVAEFVRAVLKVDGTSGGRLSAADAERLQDAKARAEANGAGAWLVYGYVLREMAEKYPSLPPPVPPAKPILDVKELPKDFDRQIGGKKGGTRQALRNLSGRWPEFGLLVVEDAHRANVPVPASLFFGPSKSADYPDAVRLFLFAQLRPKLTPAEQEALTAAVGKWPDHPKKVVELAKKYDLPVPGVTLPGPPSQWEKAYRVPLRGR